MMQEQGSEIDDSKEIMSETNYSSEELSLIEQIRNNAHPPILEQETEEIAQNRYISLINAFNGLGELYIQKAGIPNINTKEKIKHYIDATKFFNYAISITKERSLDSSLSLSMIEYINSEIMDIVGNTVSSTAAKNSENDKKELEDLREYTRSEVKQIEDFSDQDKIQRTRVLFETIAEKMQAFLARLYQESEAVLGTLPCGYSVIGFGSMALKTMTPYSDLEFAILTENIDPTTRDYFWQLTQLVHFRVINLGETVIEVSKLGNIITDHLIRKGVSFDLGGKTPLGRKDKPYSLIQTIDKMLYYLKNEEAKIEHIDKNLPYILEAIVYVHGDHKLCQKYIRNVKLFLFTEKNIKDQYLNCQVRAFKRLHEGVIEYNYNDPIQEKISYNNQGDLENFKPSLIGNHDEGKLFDVKREVYRLPDRFLYSLGIFNKIDAANIWEIVNQLYQSEVIGRIAKDNLHYIVTFATTLRLKTYLYYDCQKEDIFITNTLFVKNSNTESTRANKKFLFEETDLIENGNLFKYYYSVLPLYKILVRLTKLNIENKYINNNVFLNEDLYSDSYKNKGFIYCRLMQYHKAQCFFEESLKLEKNNIIGNDDVIEVQKNLGRIYRILGELNLSMTILTQAQSTVEGIYGKHHVEYAIIINSIGNVHFNMHQYENALEKYKEALQIRLALKPEMEVKVEIAKLYSQIGNTFLLLKNEQQAQEEYSLAIEIINEIKHDSDSILATISNNLGLFYYKVGQNEKNLSKLQISLEKFQHSLKIHKKLYGDIHFGIANSYNNIGLVYRAQKKYDEALINLQLSLKIKTLLYNGVIHNEIVSSYNNIGLVYKDQERYDEALETHQEALRISLELFDQYTINKTLKKIKVVFRAAFELLGIDTDKIEGYIKNLELHSIENNQKILLYWNIGIAYEALMIKEAAIENYNYALKLAKDEQDIITSLSLLKDIAFLQEKKDNVFHLSAALRYYQNNQLKLAIKRCESGLISTSDEDIFLKEYISKDLACMYNLAAIHAKNNNNIQLYIEYIEKSDLAFRKTLSIKLPDAALLTEFANFLYINNSYDEAAIYAKQAIDSQADMQDTGSRYSQLEKITVDANLQNEIDFWDEITIKNPVIFAYYLLIKSQIQLSNNEQASEFIEQFRVYIENNREPLSYSLLGYVYKELGLFTEAIEAFEQAANLFEATDTKSEYTLAVENQAICLSMPDKYATYKKTSNQDLTTYERIIEKDQTELSKSIATSKLDQQVLDMNNFNSKISNWDKNSIDQENMNEEAIRNNYKNVILGFDPTNNKLKIKGDGNCLFNSILLATKLELPDKITADINCHDLRWIVKTTLSIDKDSERKFLPALKSEIEEDVIKSTEYNDRLYYYNTEFQNILRDVNRAYIKTLTREEKEKIKSEISDLLERYDIYQEYMDKIIKAGAFGGEAEITILSEHFGIDIKVVQPNTLDNIQNVLGRSTKSITLYYNRKDHYDVILSQEAVERLPAMGIKNIIPVMKESFDAANYNFMLNKAKDFNVINPIINEKSSVSFDNPTFTIPNFNTEKEKLILDLGGLIEKRNNDNSAEIKIASDLLKKDKREELDIGRKLLTLGKDYKLQYSFLQQFGDITVEATIDANKFLATFPKDRVSFISRIINDWNNIKEEYKDVFQSIFSGDEEFLGSEIMNYNIDRLKFLLKNNVGYEEQIDCLCNIGNIYLEQKNYIDAAAVYNFALGASKKNKLSDQKIYIVEEKISRTENKFLESLNLKIDTTIQAINQRKQILQDTRIATSTPVEEETSRDWSRRICEQNIKFFKILIEECKLKLGDPGYQYSIIALGSAARGIATLYSDIDFAILINDDDKKEESKNYFRNLATLLNVMVINLGETTPKIQDIKGLNFLQTFSFVKNGLSFDGRAKGGCKTPLGNTHRSNIENSKYIFELIATPEELASFQDLEWFGFDTHLPSVLQTFELIEGDNVLVSEYNKEIKNSLSSFVLYKDKMISLREYMSHTLLRQDISRFEPNAARHVEEGKVYNIKYELFRLPMLIIDDLAMIHELVKNNIWERIEELSLREVINKEGEKNLIKLINLSTKLRIEAYNFYGEQNDDILSIDKTTDNKEILDKFIIPEEEIISSYFYLFPLFDIMESYANLFSTGNKIELTSADFFDNTDLTKGRVYFKLQLFDKAIHYLKEAEKDQLLKKEMVNLGLVSPNKSLVVLLDLVHIYKFMAHTFLHIQDINSAVEYTKKRLAIIEENFVAYETPLHASILSDLGDYLYIQKQYSETKLYYDQAISMMKKIYDESHPDLILTISNYNRLLYDTEEYHSGYKLSSINTQLGKETFGKHPIAASIMSHQADVLNTLGKKAEAEKISKEALDNMIIIHGELHPYIFVFAEKYAELLFENKKYEESKAYYLKVIEVINHNKDKFKNKLPSIYIKLASVEAFLGNMKEATRYLKESEILASENEITGIDSAILYINKAKLLCASSEFYDAKIELQEAYGILLSISNQEKDKESYQEVLIQCLEELLAVSYKLKELEDVAKFANELVDITQTLPSPQMDKIIMCLQFLTTAYVGLNKPEELLSCMLKELSIKEKMFGELHQDTIEIIRKIGIQYELMGNIDESRKYDQRRIELKRQLEGEKLELIIDSTVEEYEKRKELSKLVFRSSDKDPLQEEKSLSEKKKLYGENSIEYAHAISELAGTYGGQKRYIQAIEKYKEALELYKVHAVLDKSHLYSQIAVLGNIGSIYLSCLNQVNEALKYFLTAVELFERNVDFSINQELISSYIGMLDHCGIAYGKINEKHKRVAYQEKAIQIANKYLDKYDPKMSLVLNNLANGYTEIKDYSKAIKCYEEALEIRKIIYDEDDTRIKNTQKNLEWARLQQNFAITDKIFEKRLRGEELDSNKKQYLEQEKALLSSNENKNYKEQSFNELSCSSFISSNQEAKSIVQIIEQNMHPPILKNEMQEEKNLRFNTLINSFNKLAELLISEAESEDKTLESRIVYYTEACKLLNYAINIAERKGVGSTSIALATLEYVNREIVTIFSGDIDKMNNIAETAISDKKELITLRNNVKNELAKIEKLSNVNELAQTQKLFENISKTMQDFLARIFSESEQILSNSPCSYSVIGLGSMALRTMTPYSDLEFAILTEHDNYKNDPATKDYFWKLTQLVHFRIINLKETAIPKNLLGLDLDYLIKVGVSFDLGGKTPLGRQDKDYDLVKTIDGMLLYLKNENNKIEHIDKNLPYILETCSHIYGDLAITKNYVEKSTLFLQSVDINSKTYSQNRALKRLNEGVVEFDYTNPNSISSTLIKGDIDQFDVYSNLHDNEGRLFNAKREIYRLPDRLLYGLGLFYGINGNIWKIINNLEEKNVINSAAMHNLRFAASYAILFRLKVYNHYKEQKEEIYLSSDSTRIEKFCLKASDATPNSNLFKFYYTMIELHGLLSHFCKLSVADNNDHMQILSSSNLYNNEKYIEGIINQRLLRYDNALECFKQEMTITPEFDIEKRIKLYNGIAWTLKWLGKIEEEIVYRKQIFDLTQDPSSMATAFHEEGNAYVSLRGIKNALMGAFCYDRALQLKEKIYGKNHPEYALTVNNMGNAYFACDYKEEALKYYQAALQIRKSYYREDHPTIATSHHGIGNIYKDTAKYQEALFEYQEVLRIKKKFYGDTHHAVAITLHQIGRVYEESGDYQKSLDKYKEAYSIYIKVFGELHHSCEFEINSMGDVFLKTQQYNNALEHYKKALDIGVQIYPKDDINIADMKFSIGKAYILLHMNQEALPLCLESIQIKEKIYGKESYSVSEIKFAIGDIYQNLGDYNKAEDYLFECLNFGKITTGKEKSKVIIASLLQITSMAREILNQGSNFLAIGQNETALGKYIEAAKINKRIYSDKHPQVIEIAKSKIIDIDTTMAKDFNAIGDAYRALRRYEEALKPYQKALEIYKEVNGPTDHSVAVIINLIGNVYLELKRYDNALDSYNEALTIKRAIFGNNHAEVAIVTNNIAMLFFHQGKLESALVQYEETLRIRKEYYKNNHKCVVDTTFAIGEIYKRLDRLEEAYKYFQEALELSNRILGENHPYTIVISNKVAETYDFSSIPKVSGNYISVYVAPLNIQENSELSMDKNEITLLKLEQKLASIYKIYGRGAIQAEGIIKSIINIYQQVYRPVYIDKKNSDNSKLLFKEIENAENLKDYLIEKQNDLIDKQYFDNDDLLILEQNLRHGTKRISCINLAYDYYLSAEQNKDNENEYNRLIKKADFAFYIAAELLGTSETYTEYGNFLYQQHKDQEALEYLTKVISYKNDNNILLFQANEMLPIFEEIKEEIRFYKQLSIPTYLISYYLAIKIQKKTGNIQQANDLVEELRNTIEQNAEPIFYSVLGHSFKALEKYKEATVAFQKAYDLSVETEYELAQENQAICFSMIHNVMEQEEAANVIQKVWHKYKISQMLGNSLIELEEIPDVFFNNKGLKFLKAAADILSKEKFKLFLQLCSDDFIAKQELSEDDSQEISTIINLLLDNQETASSISSSSVSSSQNQPIPNDQILESIDNLKDFIGEIELSQNPGFYQYVFNALSNNRFATPAKQVIHLANNLREYLLHLFELDHVYQDLGINNDDKATSIYEQLGYLLEFIASGQRFIGFVPRYPDFDPDDYSGGGGSSSNGNGDINNNENKAEEPMMLPLGSISNANSTDV